jgi:hypothetical protein
LAIKAASEFSAAQPADWLQRSAIQLRAEHQTLILWKRVVQGEWDPVLRRITVYGASPQRADRALVHSLAHEIGHAVLPAQLAASEHAADQFAHAFLARLSSEAISTCAAALRQLIHHQDTLALSDLQTT